MVKTYITAISLQWRNDLEKGIYHPYDFTLSNNLETSFPIIPIIAEYSTEGDNSRVIALRTENKDTGDNYNVFLKQLSEIGIKEDQVTVISIQENQSKQTGISTFLRLIDAIPDDSLVFADITYGTKPMPMYILYATIYVEKIKDSEVGGIYYGEVPRAGGKIDWDRAKLYDLTVLKNLGDVIDQLKVLEIKDIRGALQKMIEI